MPDCPKTWYCLETQDTLNRRGSSYHHHLSHAWQEPSGGGCALWQHSWSPIEAVATGPRLGTVLFYGRQSPGEGFRSRVRHMRCTVFMLSGTHQFGWQACLTQCQCIKPVGRQVIDCPIHHWMKSLKLEDLDVPSHICLHHCHLDFTVGMSGFYRKRGSRALMSMWRSQGVFASGITPWLRLGIKIWLQPQPEAARPMGGTNPATFTFTWPCRFESDRSSVSTSPLVSSQFQQIWGLQASTPVADTAGNQEAIWRLICQSSRMRTWRMPSLNQSWHWDLMVNHHALGAETSTLLPYM